MYYYYHYYFSRHIVINAVAALWEHVDPESVAATAAVAVQAPKAMRFGRWCRKCGWATTSTTRKSIISLDANSRQKIGHKHIRQESSATGATTAAEACGPVACAAVGVVQDIRPILRCVVCAVCSRLFVCACVCLGLCNVYFGVCDLHWWIERKFGRVKERVYT